MSFTNPRRTPVTRSEADGSNGLRLKTNLTLRKGATFHSPTSPPPSPQPNTFRVPSLPRRSQTNLDDVVDAHRRRAALTIGEFESTLSSNAETSSSRRSFRDESLPVPQGFLNNTIMKDTLTQEPMEMDTERRVLRPRHNRRSSRHHESDSGLGSSIASTQTQLKEAKPAATASAITRSVTAAKSESLQRLSPRAVNRIHEHTLKPLLAKPSLKDFHPIILECPRMIQENQIVCLRDLEKTLIFIAPERAKTAELYLDFCLTSIRCVQATVEYLSDREQTRPHDRPYNNGYFIDLVEQIRQHARQMQAARERQASGEEADEMDIDPTDEIKLHGGFAANGRPAELIRVKQNGKAVSLATGEPIEDLDEDTKAPVRFKRSMSEQLEDEEEILRSMARRKKNATAAELAPKKCKEPGCNKEFKRPCDLTKHEKTHSRPWKCPLPTCKYHDYGWPTEKEMDRHVNDKHSSAPQMYECLFKPCPYKSKRESNCKQHMEKAHNWTYVRTKTNGKKSSSKEGSSAKPTPLIAGMPTPDSEQSNSVLTPPDFGYHNLDFPNYPTSEEFNDGLFGAHPFEGEIQIDYSPIDNDTPSTDTEPFNNFQDMNGDFTNFEDLYNAHVQLPTPIFNKNAETFAPFAPEIHAPVPAPHISPIGQGNTMLYTPSSLAELDEGFEDYSGSGQVGEDFCLFPTNDMAKPTEFDHVDMFTTVPPSLAAGYTQPSSQDFVDYPHMDWTATEFPSYTNH